MYFGKKASDLELLNLDDVNLKILGVTIDRNLNLKSHIKTTYKEKEQQLKVLSLFVIWFYSPIAD